MKQEEVAVAKRVGCGCGMRDEIDADGMRGVVSRLSRGARLSEVVSASGSE